MTYTACVEAWSKVEPEIRACSERHYEELGQDKEHMPLDMDWDEIRRRDSFGELHVVVVRNDGDLIAYHCSFLFRALHYRSVLVSVSDVYWVKPEHRKTGAGHLLFQELERSCKARGVKLLKDAYKTYQDNGKFFESLGYRHLEKVVTKWIGD